MLIEEDQPSEPGLECGGSLRWSAERVEERLVEAFDLWRRTPGGGRWPFASDAPWHMLTRAARLEAGEIKGMDITRHLQAEDAEETRVWHGRERRRGLTRDEVAARDEASEWLGLVGAEDRRIVVLALVDKAAGRRVGWMAMRAKVGVKLGAHGLMRRYLRALATIAKALARRSASSAG